MDETTQREQQVAGLDGEPFLLDSNIFDKLAAEPDSFVRELRRAVIDGCMRLLVTHVQDDELNKVPDIERREMLRSVMTTFTERTMTAGAFADGSCRADGSCYPFDENETSAMDAWVSGNLKHTRDALIANTARRYGFILVTENRNDMVKRAKRLGVTVWDYASFRAHVCQSGK